MAVNEIRTWAKCNDGHTKLAGVNVDNVMIGKICKSAGVFQLVKDY